MTFDKLLYQRIRRKQNNNQYTRVYEKTKAGFLMRLYRNIESRVKGIQKQKHHLYAHITEIPIRSEFYLWATQSEKFHALFEEWKNSNYSRKLTPSVDRVDSTKGYEFENLEWVTHSENSRRGALSKCRKF